jgi:hypothetical protein
MLSQKISKESLLYFNTNELSVRENLKKSAELFDTSLMALKSGNKEMGIIKTFNEKSFKSEMQKLETLWKPFYNNVKILITCNI